MDYLWFWIARELVQVGLFIALIIGLFFLGWVCFEWQQWTKRRER